MNTQPTTSSANAVGASNPFDVNRFKNLYLTFDAKTVLQLDKFYRDTIIFNDPIHKIQGIDSLTTYFSGFCNQNTKCHFEFTNELVTCDQAFLQWQMHYAHPQLQQGKPLTLNGGSLIKFDSHIYYHEDFYDMGAMIYQHLPLVGWAVKKINARIIGNKE